MSDLLVRVPFVNNRARTIVKNTPIYVLMAINFTLAFVFLYHGRLLVAAVFFILTVLSALQAK
jgi:hypothetical protein